jgi:3-oxoacyl-[acyl-carrier protein] reductase
MKAAELFDLSGEVALVTGASSGLGERFARTLAANGAKVVVAARRVDRLEKLVDSIREHGGEAIAVELDVADAAAVPAGSMRRRRRLARSASWSTMQAWPRRKACST